MNKTKDWTGDTNSVFKTLGASSHGNEDRHNEDYYATEPRATELLLELEEFNNCILEPACGEGHMSDVLISRGYNVTSYDLIDRGYGKGGIDFLNQGTLFTDRCIWGGDIVTNPPYKYATEFVLKALDSIAEKHKVAMFLKIQFLESKGRYKEIFKSYPPARIYVSVARSQCCRNGDFEKYKGVGNAVCYAWYIWEKGYTGEPKIKWFNYGE